MNGMRYVSFFSKMFKDFVLRNSGLLLICIATKNNWYMIKITDMLFHIFEGKKMRIFLEFQWGYELFTYVIKDNTEACEFDGTSSEFIGRPKGKLFMKVELSR